MEPLTSRELQTLQALDQGHLVKDIAAKFGVSESTVRSHVRSLLAKFNVNSQLGALHAARKRRVI